MEGSTGSVWIISRRMVRRESTSLRNGTPLEPDNTHLTPWDLRMITVDYIQNGQHAVEHLVSSFVRALARFYPLADRHTVAEINDGVSPPSLTISLCCNDGGAEFVHAVAPGVTVRYVQGSVKLCHQKTKARILLKLDLAKAFDTVSCPFLIEVLQHRGFRSRWREWIALLLSSASSRILLNGQAGKEICNLCGQGICCHLCYLY